MRRALSFAVGAAAAFVMSGAVSAATINFTADLSGASEVPPTTSAGKGTAVATLDTATKMLTYSVEYSGLTGPAGAAHIHGPAPAGKNAAVVVPFASPASPIKGTATLTEPQIKALEAGEYYVNVHTAANKGGEIRGQLMPVK